ncbi:hypothetical protein GCM10017624_06890 [Azotobacter vinelandii]|nr:hypothetical protein GCM10017624_06890 [Azotobacter vinelandii]
MYGALALPERQPPEATEQSPCQPGKPRAINDLANGAKPPRCPRRGKLLNECCATDSHGRGHGASAVARAWVDGRSHPPWWASLRRCPPYDCAMDNGASDGHPLAWLPPGQRGAVALAAVRQQVAPQATGKTARK